MLDGKGRVKRIGLDGKSGDPIPFKARYVVDTRLEREVVFNQAWRALNENFYDPEYHGVDWPAVREQLDAVGYNGWMTIEGSGGLSLEEKNRRLDLIIAGTESSDGYTGTVPEQLAEVLGLPSITFAKSIEIADGTRTIEVGQPVGFQPLPKFGALQAGHVTKL